MNYPGTNKLTLCPAAMEAVIQEPDPSQRQRHRDERRAARRALLHEAL